MRAREIAEFARALSYIVNCNYLVMSVLPANRAADLTGEPPNT
jgi:hypothetical protein